MITIPAPSSLRAGQIWRSETLRTEILSVSGSGRVRFKTNLHPEQQMLASASDFLIWLKTTQSVLDVPEPMSGDASSQFQIRINGGCEQTISVKSGLYVSAVAAVPALFGIEPDAYPVEIEIWVPDLLPEYGPYLYLINEPGGSVGQKFQIRTSQTK